MDLLDIGSGGRQGSDFTEDCGLEVQPGQDVVQYLKSDERRSEARSK